MQMAFYSIPSRGDAAMQEELNAFLRSHRVLSVHREFIQLAAIAKERPASAAQLQQIEGIGEAKAGKYAEGVSGVLAEDGKGNESDSTL